MSRDLKLSTALALTVAMDELVKLMPTSDSDRLGKALHIAADNAIRYNADLRLYFYQSPTFATPYAININRTLTTGDLHDASCACPDHEQRGAICKHILAAWLAGRVRDILMAAAQLQTIAAIDTAARYVQWALG
ncbi:MAG: SWIM zinc finger family protein [Anaerolineae bacterium]